MELRIGHGLDAHRLVSGRPLMLGGVRVAYDRGLIGHSDGDAVAHALCDALLGAAGLGDMGQHFPSTQPRWRDTPGVEFLSAVAAQIHHAGWELVSAQVVAIAEEPRLSAHLADMQRSCARALGVEQARVQVTATTTDGMGFAGRGHGIAASAVALLRHSGSG